MTVFTVFLVVTFAGLIAVPVAVGYCSSTRTRGVVVAVVLAVLGMLGATFRLWYFDIADGMGRTSGNLALQINLVKVTVVFAIVGAFLAAFGYRLRKQQIARNA